MTIEQSLAAIKDSLDKSRQTLAALRLAIDALSFIKQHGGGFVARRASAALDEICDVMK